MTTYITDAAGTRWALVPAEPTREMLSGDKIGDGISINDALATATYAAMIAAAPPFPTEALVKTMQTILTNEMEICVGGVTGPFNLQYKIVSDRTARAVIAAVFKDGE